MLPFRTGNVPLLVNSRMHLRRVRLSLSLSTHDWHAGMFVVSSYQVLLSSTWHLRFQARQPRLMLAKLRPTVSASMFRGNNLETHIERIPPHKVLIILLHKLLPLLHQLLPLLLRLSKTDRKVTRIHHLLHQFRR